MGITEFAVVLALSAIGASGVSAQEAKQDFKLVNSSGYELKELYVSPSKESDWQDDVLGQATLADGEFANVHFHRSATACKWDLKVVYSVDSSSAVWSDIDLCSVEKITIHYRRRQNGCEPRLSSFSTSPARTTDWSRKQPPA
jgi:hypothetical protein